MTSHYSWNKSLDSESPWQSLWAQTCCCCIKQQALISLRFVTTVQERTMTDALEYIKELTGNIYGVWKMILKALLVSNGLQQQADYTVDDEKPTDIQNSGQVLALIILARDDDQMVHVKKYKIEGNWWNKLKSTCAEPRPANRVCLHERHFTLQPRNREETRQQLQELAIART